MGIERVVEPAGASPAGVDANDFEFDLAIVGSGGGAFSAAIAARDRDRSFRGQDGNPAFPFVWNSTGSLGQQYNVRAHDTTLVHDARGKVVYRDVSPDLAALGAAFRAAGVT